MTGPRCSKCGITFRHKELEGMLPWTRTIVAPRARPTLKFNISHSSCLRTSPAQKPGKKEMQLHNRHWAQLQGSILAAPCMQKKQ
eukprot:6205595-Pleurochrysis_carterae.AAC.5